MSDQFRNAHERGQRQYIMHLQDQLIKELDGDVSKLYKAVAKRRFHSKTYKEGAATPCLYEEDPKQIVGYNTEKQKPHAESQLAASDGITC